MTKKITYQDAAELTDFLKSLAVMTDNETLIDSWEITDLPLNITKVLNAITISYDLDSKRNNAKSMASVIISEVVPEISAEELMDADNITFKNIYLINRDRINDLEILELEYNM